MAERSRPPPTPFEPLSELGRKYSAQIEAARKELLAEWNERLRGRPPTKRELRDYCKILLDTPHLIQGPYAPYIFLILRAWFAKAIPPKRPYAAKQIAELVDWVIEFKNIAWQSA